MDPSQLPHLRLCPCGSIASAFVLTKIRQLSPMKWSYDYLPDTKEVNGYKATECLLEPLDEVHFAWMSGPVVSVCKRNLLHVVF